MYIYIYTLTNSNYCCAAMRLQAVPWRQRRRIIFFCSHLEHRLRPKVLYLHGARPCDSTRPQTTRQGVARTWGRTPASANLGNREVGCRPTKNLSAAAEMGGAGRGEHGYHAPADALPEAPALARRIKAAPCTHVHGAAKLKWPPLLVEVAKSVKKSASDVILLIWKNISKR